MIARLQGDSRNALQENPPPRMPSATHVCATCGVLSDARGKPCSRRTALTTSTNTEVQAASSHCHAREAKEATSRRRETATCQIPCETLFSELVTKSSFTNRGNGSILAKNRKNFLLKLVHVANGYTPNFKSL